MTEYNISQAFAEIQNELIDSMMRNFSRHRAEETAEGYNWSQWQAVQLKSLEQYRKKNSKKFNKKFSEINGKVEEMLRIARADGNAEQEAEILQAIKDGFKIPDKSLESSTGEFFKVNDRKLDALIKSTTDDLKKAETAVLRMSNDKYRKAIFNAQVYANSGAGTYEKAVDMACRDMLRAGLNCVEYKNGARHTLEDYTEMAIRTANKRAYLRGEGEKRQEFGITTVVVNSRRGGCSHCAKYIGKVFIDDVYSGGKQSDGNYPLLSKAIEDGLFHPRCKDSTSTYYEGITTLKPVTPEEMAEMDRREKLEQQKSYYDNQAKKNQRIADYSLDEDNKRIYQHRVKQSQKKADGIGEKLNGTVAKLGESGIIKNIKLPVETSQIRTMSKETQKEIFDAFDHITDEYDVKIDEIVSKPLGSEYLNVPFQFQPDRNKNGDFIKRIVINTEYDFMGSQKEFKNRILRNYNKGVLSSNSVEGLIAHELAHVMTFQDVNTYTGYLIRNKEVTKRFVYGISDYADASLDGAECIAEAFASVRCGNKVSKDALNLLDEFIERWKK